MKDLPSGLELYHLQRKRYLPPTRIIRSARKDVAASAAGYLSTSTDSPSGVVVLTTTEPPSISSTRITNGSATQCMPSRGRHTRSMENPTFSPACDPSFALLYIWCTMLSLSTGDMSRGQSQR